MLSDKEMLTEPDDYYDALALTLIGLDQIHLRSTKAREEYNVGELAIALRIEHAMCARLKRLRRDWVSTIEEELEEVKPS